MRLQKFISKTALFTLLCVGLSTAPAWAQFSSGVEGTAHDQTGATIAGATVTLTDTRLGVTKVATTNQDGYFRIDSIGASSYTVQITMAGFKTWDQKDLVLQVGEIRTIAPAMEVGSISHQRHRLRGPGLDQSRSAHDRRGHFRMILVQQTPLPGQNVYSLSTLTPGITGNAVTSQATTFTNEYAININAAGLRQEQNGFQIDGAYTNTPSRGGGTSISPNPEIVSSLEIRTNDFDASKGRNGGATVNVFTQSGTNTVHGTFDYYFTNNTLTGLTYFESKVPTFTRNEVGATIGAPIIKNKFFIFGAIDVLRSTSTQRRSYTPWKRRTSIPGCRTTCQTQWLRQSLKRRRPPFSHYWSSFIRCRTAGAEPWLLRAAAPASPQP